MERNITDINYNKIDEICLAKTICIKEIENIKNLINSSDLNTFEKEIYQSSINFKLKLIEKIDRILNKSTSFLNC